MIKIPDGDYAIDYLHYVKQALDYENAELLGELPSIEALFEYYNLWQHYGTEFLEGIQQCIKDGADKKPLLKFIKKYKLNWSVE